VVIRKYLYEYLKFSKDPNPSRNSVCACVVIGDSVAQLGDDINKGLNPL